MKTTSDTFLLQLTKLPHPPSTMDRSYDMAVPLTAMTSDPNGKGPGLLWEQAHPSEIDSLRPSTPDPGAREEKKEKEEEAAREEEERQTNRILWSSKREYLLSTIGYSVGIGNLLRFPYVCNRNGGGAFLIPFLLSLMMIGLPLFAMEVVLGQFSGRNTQQVWAICPLFKGVGWAMVICATITFYYYTTVMAWSFYYLVSSFQSVVPWALCGGWWNTPHCFTYSELIKSSSQSDNTSSMSSSLFANGMNYTMASNTTIGGNLSVTGSDATAIQKVSSAEEFWQHNVLQLSEGFGDFGSVVWYLALAQGTSLFLCFCALVKGIRSSGKVVYVTATAPYLLVTALLVRGATLPGAVDGVLFYIRPDFIKLLQPQVWIEAALQVFYSLGPCWGGMIVMASYNKFHNNCLRDSLILTLVSEGTSIFGGFAIFSVLGHMAHVSGLDIDKVVSSGPGLAFIAYPEAISLMPLPQLWAFLFFFMMITLSIDSQITNAEVGLTTIIDLYPRVLHRRRAVVTAIFCSVFFLISLPFVTQGGVYLFQLVDWFIGAVTVILIGFIGCLVVGWIYGVSRFGDDIYLMLGRRPPFILCLFWQYITPSLLLVLLVATFVNYTPPTYGDYVYGPGGTGFGWCVAFASFIPIPAVAVHHLWKAQGTIAQRLRQTTKPDYTIWKPADVTAALDYRNELPEHV